MSIGANKNYELGGIQQRKQSSVPIPPVRRLRGYAFDPSLSIVLETSFINEIIFEVDWEGFENSPLQPGPIGEYLEVIDYDPASRCFYEPIDLNDPYILAQDGLAPAEGNPQFHQQMVYAVAMTTIRNFERALGRWAMWAPFTEEGHPPLFIKRLRIYPHGLRQSNAYYSTAKKAILFGYFPASPRTADIHIPGGTVFTCLSHDIIAHEITHALLDGMHQRFIEPVHPDNLAFHEAFADIVSLFQHFTFQGVLENQIAKTRGDLSSQSLLGQLAQQFGMAIGNYGALRNAIGEVNPETNRWELIKPDPNAYFAKTEPHDRGSILVGAVFDAFISIYNKRVADFKRIASNGTGILQEGELLPDLVTRLANEASRAAQHILTMCIRALDYCPPNEISFGDYLRAIITADYDLVPNDNLGYRIAFIEAFKRRGIFPRNVPSMSVDSLRWKMPHELAFADTSIANQSDDFQKVIRELQDATTGAALIQTREQAFEFSHLIGKKFKEKISNESIRNNRWFREVSGLDLAKKDPENNTSGLKLDKDNYPLFEIHSVRLSARTGPSGNTLDQLILTVSQEKEGQLPGGYKFRGGATLLIDWKNLTLKYAIKRRIDDEARVNEQRDYLRNHIGLSLRDTYFGPSTNEPFIALHGGGGE